MKRRYRRDDRGYLLIAEGYRLATAEILYRMPDHPALLQTFVWQDYDLPPSFPALAKFLTFWRDNLDGALYSVRVTASNPLATGRWNAVAHSFALH
jgi:uncharacterized protein Usg